MTDQEAIREVRIGAPRRGSSRHYSPFQPAVHPILGQSIEIRIFRYAKLSIEIAHDLASANLCNAIELTVMAEADRKPRFGTSKGGGPQCLSCFAFSPSRPRMAA
jgi:hypothetical protein